MPTTLKGLFLFFLAVSCNFPTFSQHDCSISAGKKITPGAVSPTFSSLEEKYDVKFYFLDLFVDGTSINIKGSTSINFQMLDNADTIAFELGNNASIDSIFINESRTFSYHHSEDLIKIFPSTLFDKTSFYTLKVFYHTNEQTGSGLYKGVSQGSETKYKKQATWSLSEPFQAKDWFVCKQDLNDKADSVWVYITTPKSQMAGSNGLLTKITPLKNNQHRFEWKSKYPIAYYLISFSVSDYIDYSFYVSAPGWEDSLLVQNFIYNDKNILKHEKERIDATADLLIYFSQIFGPYPFRQEKYGHCMAPMGGGMEHQTMTTLVNFNFELVAHELAHQWFGDNVTCASWRDIWVNEGFASYAEYLALEALKGKKEASAWMVYAHSFALNYPDASIYLSPEEAKDHDRIFDYGLTYKKGAAILHMLRKEINNDDLFFQAFREYQNQFRDSVALTRDFLEVVNQVTNDDYSWFFDQWYYGKGFPVIQTTWNQDTDSAHVEVLQHSSSNEQQFFRANIDYKFIFEDGSDTTLRFKLTKNLEKFSIGLDKRVEGVLEDPDGDILMKSVIYKMFPKDVLFDVFPIPFSYSFKIEFRKFQPNAKVYLTDLKGCILYEERVSGSSMEFEFPELIEGIYFFMLIDGEGKKYATKIMKINI